MCVDPLENAVRMKIYNMVRASHHRPSHTTHHTDKRHSVRCISFLNEINQTQELGARGGGRRQVVVAAAAAAAAATAKASERAYGSRSISGK